MTLTKKKMVALSVILVLLVAAVVLAIVLRPRLQYELSEDGTYYTVTGVEGLAVWITIPAEHEGISVRRIEPCAFQWQTFLRSVKISEGVKSVGFLAFEGCPMLRRVVIPDSVTYVGTSVFSRCASLESVTIGKGLTAIPDGTFHGCISLPSFAVPEHIIAIGENAFTDCTSLKSLTLHDGISLGSWAFSGCTALEMLEIPSGVKVGNYAFKGCSALNALTLPDGISLGYRAFEDCVNLVDIRLNGNIGSVGRNAFINTPFFAEQAVCENGIYYLFDAAVAIDSTHSFEGEVTFREGTRVIANALFSGYEAPENAEAPLMSVTVPASVSHVGFYAFANCTALGAIHFAGAPDYLGESAFEGCTALADVHFTKGPTYIGENTFKGCTALKELVIPDGTKTIGNEAFADCSALSRIALPGTLHTVYFSALKNCTALKRIELGEGIQKVQGFASGSPLGPLEYLNIPRSVTYLFLGRLEISVQNLHIEDPNGWTFRGESVDLLKELEDSWNYTITWIKSIPEAE